MIHKPDNGATSDHRETKPKSAWGQAATTTRSTVHKYHTNKRYASTGHNRVERKTTAYANKRDSIHRDNTNRTPTRYLIFRHELGQVRRAAHQHAKGARAGQQPLVANRLVDLWRRDFIQQRSQKTAYSAVHDQMCFKQAQSHLEKERR